MDYSIHFRRDFDTRDDYQEIGRAATLEEALLTRKVSGDLVTHRGLVVDSQDWLFAWERADQNCYAQRAIRADREYRSHLSREAVSTFPLRISDSVKTQPSQDR